jgi:phosphomannomutase
MGKFEEKLLADIEKALQEIKTSGATAISKDKLSPMLRAYVRTAFGAVPEKFSVQFLENIRDILSAKLAESLPALPEAADGNKALSSSATARQTRQSVADLLAGMATEDLNDILSDLKEKFDLKGINMVPDGRFPGHPPDPLRPESKDGIARVCIRD